MVKEVYSVRWDRHALIQLEEIYSYILQDSYQNARKVKQTILELTAGLKTDPKRYNVDKLRLDKNPDFRALDIYRIRISFFVDETDLTVIILRVRNTWQEPLEY